MAIKSGGWKADRWANGIFQGHQTLFFWAPKSLQMVTAAMKLKDAYSLEGKLRPRSGGEKGLRGSGAGTLGVPLGGTRRVGFIHDHWKNYSLD